jgi:hypothetical protein
MKSVWRFLTIGLAASALSLSALAQGTDFSKIEIATDRIAANLYMLSGSAGLDPGHEDAAGGRIGVLEGPDGILMVDAQYPQLTDKVLAAIRRISPRPFVFWSTLTSISITRAATRTLPRWESQFSRAMSYAKK